MNLNPFARRNSRGAARGQARGNGRGAPFAVLPGAARRERINAGMFDAGRSHIAGSEFLLASFAVPRGELMVAERLPMRLYLKHHENFTSTNDANTSEQFTMAGVNMVRTVRSAPAFPTQAHPDIQAYEDDGSGNWVATNVTAADFDANTVTVAKTANVARSIRIYVTGSNGQVRFAAIAPAGSGAIEAPVFNQSFGGLNEADQAKANSAFVLPESFGRDLFLTGKFKLGIYVTSTPAMEWADRAKHEISIPVQRRGIQVLDHQGTVRATLSKLGV